MAETVTVIIDRPAPGAGIETGLKLTFTPAGAPLADKATALLKLPVMVVSRVAVFWWPGETAIAVGASRLKSGGVGTVTVSRTVAVSVMPPPLAVMVTG